MLKLHKIQKKLGHIKDQMIGFEVFRVEGW